jgi:hypothetical protein
MFRRAATNSVQPRRVRLSVSRRMETSVTKSTIGFDSAWHALVARSSAASTTSVVVTNRARAKAATSSARPLLTRCRSGHQRSAVIAFSSSTAITTEINLALAGPAWPVKHHDPLFTRIAVSCMVDRAL